MSTVNSGNKNHDNTCNTAESVRQSAAVPGASQATVRAADIAFYRACLASALTNGVHPNPFITALRELGTGGS